MQESSGRANSARKNPAPRSLALDLGPFPDVMEHQDTEGSREGDSQDAPEQSAEEGCADHDTMMMVMG